jgi:DNA-binding transcriptional LysR family regulator
MIRELTTLLAVARLGSFSAAGARLGLTQSAVSAQMQKLERVLGSRLFERTRRTATLNEAGHNAVLAAQEIVALFEAMIQEPGRQAPNPALPTLRVGAISSVQPVLFTRALGSFRERFPGARIRVQPGVSLSLLGELGARELDLAVMIRPPFPLPPELLWQTLLVEPFVLVIPRASPHDDWRTALRDEPFIRYDRASFGGRLIEQFLRRRRIVVNESLELDELDALIAAVEAGLGVALLPQTHSHQDGRFNVKILPLGAASFVREIGIVRLKDGDIGGSIEALADDLVRAARSLG